MSLKLRIYYNAIFGAIGGLIGWFIIESFLSLDNLNIFLSDAIWGVVMGFLIGAFIGAVDGSLSKNLYRILVGCSGGALMGAVGGMVGLTIGEGLFLLGGGGIVGRSLGWAIFGLLVGTSEGLVNRSPRKVSYGTIGGAIGGLIGGSVFDALSRAFAHQAQNLMNQTLSRAVGLIVLGACIGSLIGLVEDILKVAWLKVISGKHEGKEFTITKKVTVIGAAEQSDIPLFGDAQIAQHHAQIRQDKKEFWLEDISNRNNSFVNQQLITAPQMLNHGDTIQLGQTKVLFNYPKGASPPSPPSPKAFGEGGRGGEVKENINMKVKPRHLSFLSIIFALFILSAPVSFSFTPLEIFLGMPPLASAAWISNGVTVTISQIDHRSNFPSIILHVSVTDPSGQPIQHLEQEAFSITEDDRPVHISDFLGTGVEVPITTVLVIDKSGSMANAGKLTGAKQAAIKFVTLARQADKIGLIAFSDSVKVIQDITAPNGLLQQRIRSIQKGSGTAYYDAVYKAIENLSVIEGRKAVVALTDGKDNKSHVSMNTVIQFAQENSTPLYIVGLGMLSATGDAGIDEASLKQMANQTGGRYFYSPSAAELENLYKLIMMQIQNEYQITHTSPRPQKDGTRRKVTVTITHNNVENTAESSYLVPGVIGSGFGAQWWVFLALLLPLIFLLFLPTIIKKLIAHRKLAPSLTTTAVTATPPVQQISGLVSKPLNSGVASTSASPKIAQQSVAPTTPTAAALIASGHHFSVDKFPLSRAIINIGRETGNDLMINHESVSRRHAQIKQEQGRYVVYDLGSTNGTFVSFTGDVTKERRVTQNALKNGSLVRFGNVTFLMELINE
jgi:VWFA-related protein